MEVGGIKQKRLRRGGNGPLSGSSKLKEIFRFFD